MILWSYCWVVFRAVKAFAFLAGGTVGILFAISSLVAVVTTVVALRKGKVDLSLTGAIVPLLYCSPMLLVVAGVGAAEWVIGPFWVLCVCQWGLRLYMGVSCTVAAPVWCKLRDKGPYRLIRHPLALLEMAMVIAFVLRFPCTWNLAMLPCIVAAKMAAVLIEERFLFGEESYCRYAEKVRWRWIPGVW